MKKIALLLWVAILGVQPSQAQFSQAVKDTVLKLLKYPTANYSITLVFKPEDYLEPSGKPDLQKLSRQALNDQKKGDYTDASIYQALFVKSWFEDKNQQEAVQFLSEAGQRYQTWINAEPNNATPVDELLSMCISSQNPQMMSGVLDYALPLFPKHLPLLNNAIFYEQYFAKRYDKSEQLIQQARAIDSFNLTTLAYLSGLHAIRQIEAMQQKKPIPYAEIPGLHTATMVRQPNHAGLRHLYHYHQVFNIYMNVAAYAMGVDTSSLNLFDFYTFTPQETKVIEEAQSWMEAQLALKGKNELQMLNSLAVIHCMKKEYAKAIVYFDKAYQINKGGGELDGQVMCQMFLDAYPQVEKLLEQKIATSGNVQDYGSLLKVYSDYTKKSEAELTLLKKLQALSINDPTKHQILATGYLKTRQLSLLPESLALLGETNKDDLMIKLVAAIVNDKRSTAAVYVNKLLNMAPDHENGLAIKKLAGL